MFYNLITVLSQIFRVQSIKNFLGGVFLKLDSSRLHRDTDNKSLSTSASGTPSDKLSKLVALLLPAPFLPPEIISRILDFIPEHAHCTCCKADGNLEFSATSRISKCWKLESQTRLFKGILIKSSEKLSKVVDSLEHGLGSLINSLIIEIEEEGSPADAHNVFLLLKSATNLEVLRLATPTFTRFNVEDEALLRAGHLLPNLRYLSCSSENEDWSREVFDPLVVTSPNISDLSLDSRVDYEGPLWTPPSFSHLVTLILVGQSILEGKLFEVEAFEGLEKLEITIPFERSEVEEETEYEDEREDEITKYLDPATIPFFEAVGPSLECLELQGALLPVPYYSFLTRLEFLSIHEPDRQENQDIEYFPSTLNALKVRIYDGTINLPLSALSNLTELTIHSCRDSLDFSTFPRLNVISILEMRALALLESMENLIPGEVQCCILILGREATPIEEDRRLSENQAIIDRCKDLRLMILDIDVVNSWR